MPRFQAGSRYAERQRVVVTMRKVREKEKSGCKSPGLRGRSPRLRGRARSLDHALVGTQMVFHALEVIPRLHREADQELAGAALAEEVVGFVEFDERVVQFAKRAVRFLIDALTPEVDDLRTRRVLHGVTLLFQHEVVGQIGDKEAETFIQHARGLPWRAPHDVGGCTEAIDRLCFGLSEAAGLVTSRKSASARSVL